MYYGELYEDKFNLYLCVFKEGNGHNLSCVCVEAIPLSTGKGKDGSYSELVTALEGDAEAWRQWHGEQPPHLFYMRELCYRATKVGMSKDNFAGWEIDYHSISGRAAAAISDECESCNLSGLMED